jgi:hypothetical protein
MKRFRNAVILALAAAAIFTCLLLNSSSADEKAAKKVRLMLRAQGFKTDLSEFDFSTTPEFRTRMASLTNAPGFQLRATADEIALRSRLQLAALDLMKSVDSN